MQEKNGENTTSSVTKRSRLPFDVKLTLHLSINLFCSWANRGRDHKSDKKNRFECIGLKGLKGDVSSLRLPFVRNF